jgi:predicted CXXCH cytochrome family protein
MLGLLVVLGTTVAVRARLHREAPPQEHRAWAQDAKPAGSKSCEKCHPEHYQRWEDSAHSRMVRLPGPQSVVGDFTRDNVLRWKGYTYRMFVKDGRYFMTVEPPRGDSTTYPIDFVLGSRRIQGYMSKLADGRLYLLPAYYHIVTRSWFDSSLITPHTKDGVGVKQYWNTNCLACHATDLRFGFDPTSGQYSTRYVELAIGCEACHNPGSKHNEFFEKKPLRDYVRKEFNDTYISNQRYFDFVRSTELCASCHGAKINYFLGYWPGDEGYDYFVPLTMTFTSSDSQGEFYPDGRPTRFNHFMDFMGSQCFLKGKATCMSCHEGHSSPNDSLLQVPKEQSNALCLNCHQEKYGGAKLTAHTFHLPDSPGSRCYECHMDESLYRVLMLRRDHSLDNPIPENSIRYGVSNACNNRNCHPDRTAEWAIRTLDQWYGPGNRQKLLYASEAMWLAKARDERAIPLLIRALGDTNLRVMLRASAAGALASSFGAKAQGAVPALIQQMSAPEPFIQIAAARALGAIGDRRAIAPLTRALGADLRVMRITAASSLLGLGIVRLQGEDGRRLETAKQDFIQALRNWPNVPEFRIDLGNYHFVHAAYQDALAEYEVAIRLDPTLPEAWYFTGQAQARLGRLDRALEAWKKVREMKPDFPNIDELVRATEQQIKKEGGGTVRSASPGPPRPEPARR